MTRKPVLIFSIAITALAIACGSDSDSPAAAPADSSAISTSAADLNASPTEPPTAEPGAGSTLADLVSRNLENDGQHLAPDIRVSSYTERPATFGPHWFAPDTTFGVPAPARWGVYEFELPDEILIHNLEHGGVGIHYN